MECRRRQGQNKKQFYRRIAEYKKQIWVRYHQQQEEDAFKAHFSPQEEDSYPDSNKSKKITKTEYKAEQRLRNRVAAQESRERHRFYVEQLERKVKMYEEMLEREGGLCRNCRKNMQSETQECQSNIGSSMSDQFQSSRFSNDDVQDAAFLNSLLKQQTVRIDNNGATTPFGVFFIICIVAVLAIFSFNVGPDTDTPRLLTNYHETLSKLIHFQDDILGNQITRQLQENPKKHRSALLSAQNDGPPIDQEEVSFLMSQNESNKNSWKKYGKYICSEPELFSNEKLRNNKKNPEFLLLRTRNNSTKIEKSQEIENNPLEHQSYQIVPQDWSTVELSSCFIGDL